MKKPLDKHFPIQTETDDLVSQVPKERLLEVLQSLKKNVGHKEKVYHRRNKEALILLRA